MHHYLNVQMYYLNARVVPSLDTTAARCSHSAREGSRPLGSFDLGGRLARGSGFQEFLARGVALSVLLVEHRHDAGGSE